MNRHRFLLLLQAPALTLFAGLSLAAAQPPIDCGAGSGSAISVTNLEGGEEVGYELLFIRGTLAGSAATLVKVTHAGDSRNWPVEDGRFKALVPLKKGLNTIGLTAYGHKNACLEIRYNPMQLGPVVQFLFVAGKEKDEGPGLIPALPGSPSDFASVKKRIALTALLAQTAMAELLHQAGKPRLTFAPSRDAQGGVDVRLWHSPFTTGEIEAAASRKEDYIAAMRDGIRQDYPVPGLKFMLYIQPADPWPAQFGDFGWATASTLYSYAESLDRLVTCFSDTRSPKLLGLPLSQDDGTFHADAFWKDYAAGVGATLHELGHVFGLPHSGPDSDVMRFGNYHANRLFMVKEPGGPFPAESIEWADTSRALLLGHPSIRGPLAFRKAETLAMTDRGLKFGYFEGNWRSLPDMGQMTALRHGVVPRIGLDVEHREDNFALSFSGYIEIPETDEYGFFMKSDEGGRLHVGDTLLIDRSGPAASGAVASLGLESGMHRLRLDYFEWAGEQSVELLWQRVGADFAPIPDSLFFHESGFAVPSMAEPPSARFSPAGRDIRVFLRSPEEHVVFAVYSSTGRLLQILHTGPLPSGEARFAVSAALPPGSLAVWKGAGKARTLVLPR